MVSVNQQKIDGAAPVANGFMAEVFYPDDFGAGFHGNCPSGGAAEEIQCPHPRKMKWVHKIQNATGIHGGAEGDGGGSLGDTDLHEAGASARKLLQGLMFLQSVLRDRRAKSGPSEERMLQGAGFPRGLRGGLKANELNRCSRHGDFRPL
jgi:hypothetical protein